MRGLPRGRGEYKKCSGECPGGAPARARWSDHFGVLQERLFFEILSVAAGAVDGHTARLAPSLHVVPAGRGGRQKCPGGCRGGAPALSRCSGRFGVFQERLFFEFLSVAAGAVDGHTARLAPSLHVVPSGRGGRQKCSGGCREGASALSRCSGVFQVLQERSFPSDGRSPQARSIRAPAGLGRPLRAFPLDRGGHQKCSEGCRGAAPVRAWCSRHLRVLHNRSIGGRSSVPAVLLQSS